MLSQAVLFVTHIESERIERHFERLRAELDGLLPALLCRHRPEDDCIIPTRLEEMQAAGLTVADGFGELAWLPMVRRLKDFDHCWIVEYDADYAGNWRDFFTRTIASDADLIGTAMMPRSGHQDWNHWSWFEPPSDVDASYHTRGFLPVSRFSRRWIDAYLDEQSSGRWRGHYEAIFPTFTLHRGMVLADLGIGPFCPPEWNGKNYRGRYHDEPRTFQWRPVASDVYFHEDASRFPLADLLYHPVKPG